MSSEEDIDYSEIQSALESIGQSAALIFGATLLSQGLGFVTRIIMARYLPVNGYGNVVIGLSVLNLFGIAALVGMPSALSRFLPRQETDDDRRNILSSAFQIVVIISVLIATIIFLMAETLAIYVFGNADLVRIIRIFAGILPFYAMFKLSLGGFRGYEITYPKVLIQNVLRPVFQLVGIVIFITVGYGTVGIAFAYAVAFGIVAIIGLFLLYKISDIEYHNVIKIRSSEQYRDLLRFSIPLTAAGAIGIITKHSDLIILEIYKSSTLVGLYEVTFRMAIFVHLFFTLAIGYLFQPIVSRLDSGKNYKLFSRSLQDGWLLRHSPFLLYFSYFQANQLHSFLEKNIKARN
ncbi:MAG: oligosaccharide flippase family protein [Halobacteriaceae archaeon]